MSNIRARIEQRITDLRVERDIAAAALTPAWFTAPDLRDGDDGFGFAVSEYVASLSPATVIARIDRELAGCAAALDLLDNPDVAENADNPYTSGIPWVDDVTRYLNARYPSEESS